MTAQYGPWTASNSYTLGQTITDSNGNIEQCSQAGTSGTSVPAWPTTTTPGVGIGSAPVPYPVGTITTDNTVKWSLVGTTSNVWTTQAEELIRSRALKNLYARYLRDTEQAEIMERLETQALANMQYKNVGRIALGRVRIHL